MRVLGFLLTETGTVGEIVERSVVVLVLDGLRFDESSGDGCSSAADMPTDEILPVMASWELVSVSWPTR
ncbi:MAG: hypothetical protein ACI8S6_001815 [Myxococcota bacterium]|jgi:hypothetical protein